MSDRQSNTFWQRWRARWPKRNRTYILPTGKGLIYCLTIVAMVLTAATYNNNLIYILAFFMFSVLIVSMVQTHYNVDGVQFNVLSVGDAFATEPNRLVFQLEQRRAKRKNALEIRAKSKSLLSVDSGRESRQSLDGLERQKAIRGEIRSLERGVFPLPPFIVESSFPLGLFRAWKVFRPSGEVIVYPRPEGVATLSPTNHAAGDLDFGLTGSPEGDFGELKPYVVGESYHQIAWKHFAKLGVLYTKVHWGEDHRHYDIPGGVMGQQDFEAHLRQVSAWIKMALDENATFALELPTGSIEIGSGVEHAKRCWRELARLQVVRD